jgi:hypothetical protein
MQESQVHASGIAHAAELLVVMRQGTVGGDAAIEIENALSKELMCNTLLFSGTAG